MRKIGIMGGTFNPVHLGHIQIAKTAYQQFAMEKVLFLPNKTPPHKQDKKLVGNRERMDMIAMAIQPFPYFELSTLEMDRRGVSYTVDTLRDLADLLPNVRLYFIIGADSLHTLDSWKCPGEILKLSSILSAPRYPATAKEDQRCREHLIQKYGGSIEFLRMPPVKTASRTIVEKLRQGLDVSEDLPADVYSYIRKNHLYERKDNR